MNYIKQYKKQVFLMIILLLGIGVGVYLVKLPQIFKSRANQEVYNTFQVTQTTTDGETELANCQDTENGYTCNTDSLEINLRVDADELEKLFQE